MKDKSLKSPITRIILIVMLISTAQVVAAYKGSAEEWCPQYNVYKSQYESAGVALSAAALLTRTGSSSERVRANAQVTQLVQLRNSLNSLMQKALDECGKQGTSGGTPGGTSGATEKCSNIKVIFQRFTTIPEGRHGTSQFNVNQGSVEWRFPTLSFHQWDPFYSCNGNLVKNPQVQILASVSTPKVCGIEFLRTYKSDAGWGLISVYTMNFKNPGYCNLTLSVNPSDLDPMFLVPEPWNYRFQVLTELKCVNKAGVKVKTISTSYKCPAGLKKVTN